MNAVQERNFVALDYPEQGERLSSRHYSFRISASRDVRKVELTIDGGEPVECRESAGFFWYDWTGFAPGRHEVSALATFVDGTQEMTKIRRMQVEAPSFESAPN